MSEKDLVCGFPHTRQSLQPAKRPRIEFFLFQESLTDRLGKSDNQMLDMWPKVEYIEQKSLENFSRTTCEDYGIVLSDILLVCSMCYTVRGLQLNVRREVATLTSHLQSHVFSEKALAILCRKTYYTQVDLKHKISLLPIMFVVSIKKRACSEVVVSQYINLTGPILLPTLRSLHQRLVGQYSSTV